MVREVMVAIPDNTGERVAIEDVLYSRTDDRGVIQAGNAVFQRVSGYDWSEMVGAPHKIVRHEAMPRGVFHLLWSTIQKGEPIGAYVVNMAKDQVPYWVFATVLPLEDEGYVSLRVRPTSSLLDVISPLYQELRSEENSGNLTPAQSAERIQSAVRELGYSDYTEFMSFALHTEVSSRQELLSREATAVQDTLAAMFEDMRDMEKHAGRVGQTFRKTNQIPYNMRLQAGRLEGSDGPISVISGNYRQMTQTLEENLSRFGSGSSVGADAVRLALFRTCAATLVKEAEQTCRSDAGEPEHWDKQEEMRLMKRLTERYQRQSMQEVQDLASEVRQFGRQCNDMRRMMSGLELTRIMCKIERSKFSGDLAGLDEIVNRLADAQTDLGKNFDDILGAVGNVLSRSEQIQRGGEHPALIA